jgi:hypothetical protein
MWGVQADDRALQEWPDQSGIPEQLWATLDAPQTSLPIAEIRQFVITIS